MSSGATILILDDDLGFAVWLGRALSQAGFQPVPASTADEAFRMLSDAGFPQLDLVIVNRDLEGSGEMLEKLEAHSQAFKVITIGDPAKTAGAAAVNDTIQRPPSRTIPSAEPYIAAVRQVLGRQS